MEKIYKNCQSCGMPMSKDKNGGGSEINGTKSLRFCSHCYQQGAFVEPNLTMEQMKVKVKDKLKAMGFPSFIAGFFTKNISQLERWR